MNRLAIIVVAMAMRPDGAAAQSAWYEFQLGAQLTSAVWGEFERADVGVGARLSWHPSQWLGIDIQMDMYPNDFPRRHPFSRGRVQGLLGSTLGPRLGRMRPFAAVRPGFLRVREAPEPLACIQIFPPPLACVLGTGRTLFVIDLGGGLEVSATGRTFVRVDAGDRLVRYPTPVFDTSGSIRRDAFFGHHFRVSAGAGVRF